MRRLLALNFLLWPIFIFAAAGEMKTTFSSVNFRGSQGSSLLAGLGSNSSVTEFSLSSPTLASMLTLRTAVANSVVDDVANSLIGHRQSNISFALELSKGAHQLFLSHSQVVTQSPIANKNYAFSYIRSFFSQTSALGLSVSESNRLQARQTFIDPVTAQSKVRPHDLRALQQEVFYEQILSDTLRGRYSLIFAQRSADRPDHAGFEIRHAFAFNNQWSTRFDFGYLEDNRSQKLKDDIGYLSATWAELFLNYEPNLDWMFQVGYGASVEKEFQPSPFITNALTQFGTDSYVFKATYQQSDWRASVAGKMSASNTGYKSDSIIGEFAWDI